MESNMYEHLIEFYKKHKNNIRHFEDSSEVKEIRSLTSFLDSSNLFDKITYKQRMIHIMENDLSLRKCAICGKPVCWDTANKCYLTTCSKECYQQYSKSDIVKNKIAKTNQERYGAVSFSATTEGKEKQRRIREERVGIPACQLYSDFANSDTKDYSSICLNVKLTEKQNRWSKVDLFRYLSSLYEGFIDEYYIVGTYAIDYYFPELKIGICYNTLIDHSNAKLDANYHRNISLACKKEGIHLIHIFEDDWKNKHEIMKSILRNFINQKNCITVYARKCEIRSVSFSDTKKFLEENHMLGRVVNFNSCLGLYYNNELISLMTFRLISKETNQYELSRYAIKKDYRIIGGAEKIFKHYINNYNFSSIITYNDNSVFKGNVYPRLGFSYIRTNSPNYMFTTIGSDCRFPKQSIRKLKVGYKIETEKALGLLRVYNAGNDVYLYER